MRPGQQNKRGRGRNNNGGPNNNNNNNGGGNNNNRRGANPLTRTYDSSGPDVKIRGTAQHIAEKYATLARDAQSSGDRVMAENYLQHAEHYNRIIAAAQAQMQERFQRDERQDYVERDIVDRFSDDGDQMDLDDTTPQPVIVERPQPAEQRADRHDRQDRGSQLAERAQGDRAPSDRGQHPAQAEQRRPTERTNPAERNNPAERPQPVVQVTPRAERAAAAKVQPQPVIDGSGPQPEIEGTPAEVVIEEQAVEAPAKAAPRRRGPGRPKRQPRTAEAGAEAAGGEGEPKPVGDGQPSLAPVAE
ncbi:DUF4167 domain-containing protein [Ensifer soli]|uniref:DUF4167 domain-containing protein n=1 Tax=Ciceribacter sp. sgz301302 TaxID=3342379 RepID=UPI0035BAEC89